MNDKPETPPDDPESLAEHRARMRHDWSNLIEDLIEEGRQSGAFDNLPGRGKPLNLNKNPYGRELEAAHNLLKNNELIPAWIAERNAVLQQIASLREEIKRVWTRHEHEFQHAQAEGHRGALTISWDDACQKWEAKIKDINKRIDTFNLKRPSNTLEIFKLKMEEELDRVGAKRWLR